MRTIHNVILITILFICWGYLQILSFNIFVVKSPTINELKDHQNKLAHELLNQRYEIDVLTELIKQK